MTNFANQYEYMELVIKGSFGLNFTSCVLRSQYVSQNAWMRRGCKNHCHYNKREKKKGENTLLCFLYFSKGGSMLKSFFKLTVSEKDFQKNLMKCISILTETTDQPRPKQFVTIIFVK